MDHASGQEGLYKIEVFGEPLVRRILGESASHRALIIIWGVFILIPMILYVIAANVDGSFTLEGDAMGLTSDFTLFVALPVFAAVFSAAVIVLPRFPEVLLSLQWVIAWKEKKGTSADDGKRMAVDEFNDILRRKQEALLGKSKSKYLRAVLVVIGLALWALATNTHWFSAETFAYGVDSWSSKNYMTSFAVRTIYEFVLYVFAAPYVLFKLVTILHIMRSTCVELTIAEVLRIRPLNPDKAGGMGAFGRYSIRLMSITSVPAILVVVYVFVLSVTTVFMVVTTLYITLLVFVFFYPLSGAHRAMLKAKQETLAMLSDQFNESYDHFMGAMKSTTIATSWADFDEVDKLDKLYVRAQAMPVWPFDLATFTRFATIIGTVTLTVWLKWALSFI